jgi:hypothetical protein
MNRILAEVLGVVLALGLGFAVGWHAKGVSVDAAGAKTSRAETQSVVDGVNKQAAAQHGDQVVEQGKSVDLGLAQNGIRATGDKLQQEIDRAPFTFPTPRVVIATTSNVSIRCPDDPVGSDDFVRLYNAAASGTDPAAAASTAAR